LSRARGITNSPIPKGALCISSGWCSSNSFEYVIEHSEAILEINLSCKDLGRLKIRYLQGRTYLMIEVFSGEDSLGDV